MDAEQVCRRYLAALSAGDVDGVLACVADEFHNDHTSALGSSSHGRDEYGRRLPRFLSEFADLGYDVVDLVADDATVAVRYRLTATYDGRPVDVPGVMWFAVRDGVIVRRTDLWDSLTFLQQVDRR